MSLTHLNASFGETCMANTTPVVVDSFQPNLVCPMDGSLEPRVFQVRPKPFGTILLEQIGAVFSFFCSQLPSFSYQGGQSSDRCESPTGSYLKSCEAPTVTYLPGEDKCLVQTRCSTIFTAIAPKDTALRFIPGDLLVLGNENGTLTIQEGSKLTCIAPEEANARLDATFEALKEIDKVLKDPFVGGSDRENLEETREDLLRQQSQIIGRLSAGDVITLDKNQQPVVITSSNKGSHEGSYCMGAFNSFQRLASSTGGIMGLSQETHHLPLVIEKLFNHILHTVQPDEFLDIAFVLDTTYSMANDIAQVQKNLLTLLKRLKDVSAKVRVALLEYRDENDAFLNKVILDFTTKLDKVETAVESIKVDGGGNHPEAVYDALLTAKNLSWKENARHIAILIGDAPPHPKTVDDRHDESSVIEQLQADNIEVAIYPILT